MSWTIFKNRMLPSMQSNRFGNDIDGFSKEFTSAYDFAIKSGSDVVYSVPVIKGNTELMQITLSSLLSQTRLSTQKTLLDVIGPAVISYWVGVEFSKIPPLIPAIGTIQNISGVSGLVISTGKWTSLTALPNNDSNIFLNTFVNSAKLHLSTISGIFNVISQYPPPAPPAPAIINWTGYKVIG